MPRSGRDVEPLPWFEALALWKAAVFCEAIYGRFVRGELGAEDERAARFEQGVPLLAEAAAEAHLARLSSSRRPTPVSDTARYGVGLRSYGGHVRTTIRSTGATIAGLTLWIDCHGSDTFCP